MNCSSSQEGRRSALHTSTAAETAGGGECLWIDGSTSSQSRLAASGVRLPERRRRPMIRFSFFNQGGRVRLDMVGAGGWIHASRLRFPSGSVANAARSWDGPHSAAVAVCWCENGERIEISWKRRRAAASRIRWCTRGGGWALVAAFACLGEY